MIVFHHPFKRFLIVALCFIACSITGLSEITFQGLQYQVIDENEKTVEVLGFGDNPVVENLVIPAQISYLDQSYKVTQIASRAFSFCENLKALTMPSSVTDMGEKAFYSCKNLTNITLSESLKSLEKEVFYGCVSLVKIRIPASVSILGENFSGNCKSLAEIEVAEGNPNFCVEDGILFNKEKDILFRCPQKRAGQYSIPESVTKINDFAFYGCYDLTSVDIPNTVNTIGRGAFILCNNITALTIPESVKLIENYAFNDWHSLESLAIPNSVDVIGAMVFVSCTNLKTVTLPSELKEVGDHLFEYSSNIESVYYNAVDPVESNLRFDGTVFDNAVLYVNPEAIEKAKTIVPWCYFNHIQPNNTSGIEDIIDNEKTNVEVYNTNGIKIGTDTEGLPSGIYLVRQGDKVKKLYVK